MMTQCRQRRILFPLSYPIGMMLVVMVAGGSVRGANLIYNADFSKLAPGSGTRPAGWQMTDEKGWSFTNEDGMNGNHSLRYASRVDQVAPSVAQKVTCQANTEYVLSAALKSDGKVQPMVRAIDGGAAKNVVTQIAASTEAGPWKRYSAKFNSGPSTSLIVELWADVRHSRNEPAPAGACGFDDVRILLAAESGDAEETGAAARYENIARGKPYTLTPNPNYALCTDPDDRIQLTDGVYTVGYFWTQKSTVGWQGARPIVITLDLGKVEPICGMSYNTAAGVAGVAWPMSISMLVSDDGKTYYAVGDLVSMSDKRDPPPATGYAVHRYWTDGLKTHGRYVQLMPDTGGGYCFVDEIEVYRGQDAWLALPLTGAATTGAADYFKRNAVNNSVRARLNVDVREAREAIKSSGLDEKSSSVLMQELSDMEAEIPELPPIDPNAFRAVFPLNDLQARILGIHGKLRRMRGSPPLTTWVSHPLDYITPTDSPYEKGNKQISVAMMRGEWRSAVLNLTSASERRMAVNLRIQGLPGGVNPDYVTVYQVEWTDTKEMKPIAVALTGVERNKEGYVIDVPAGITRQVWFTFHPVTLTPKTYSGKVVVTVPGIKHLTVPLMLRLFSMKFPGQPTLHVSGWDYTDEDVMYGVTPSNRDALIAHLQERFVDSPWGTASVLPYGTFDAQGNLTKEPDTATFDRWITRWPKARRYCVFVSVSDSIGEANIAAPTFNAHVKSWIDFWAQHAAEKGIKPEQLALLLLDEPNQNDQDKIIIAWEKAVHAAQPKVVLWEDPTYVKPSEAMPEMMSSADILCPNRTQFLEGGKQFEDFYRKQKADGRHLEFYSCSGPMHLLDPYSYVRLQAWTCWDVGAESTNFWAFGDSGGGNPWKPYTTPGNNYAPMFLAPDSVTPGKHMEAIRESVEDYEYFVMLRDAVAKAKPDNPAIAKAKDLLANGARRVLDAENANKISWLDPKDRWTAETIRVEILNALNALAK